MMKRFVAVGHWDGNKNTTCVADEANTKAGFQQMLKDNGFRAYAVLAEATFKKMQEMDCFEIYNTVKGLTTNWRKNNEVTEYIEQCGDIIEAKLEAIDWC